MTDPGGASVQVRFSGKRVDEGAKLTFQFTASAAGIVAGGGAPANGADRAFVSVSTRGRIATAGDALIAGFFLGGTAPRNLLCAPSDPRSAPSGWPMRCGALC